MKNKKVLCMALVYTFVLVALLGSLQILRYSVDEKNETETEIRITEGISEKEDFYISMTKSESWEAMDDSGKIHVGAGYDFIIYNKTGLVFHDWVIEWEKPMGGKIDSLWNGEYTEDEDKVYITPVDYNCWMLGDAEVPIGCIVLAEELIEAPTMTIHGFFMIDLKEQPMYWILIGLLIVWGLIVLVNVLVYGFTAHFKKKIEAEIEKQVMEQATYIAKGSQQIFFRNILVDLNTERYAYLEKWSKADEIPIEGKYQQFVDYMISVQTTEEEKENLRKILDKNYIISKIGEDKEEIKFVSHTILNDEEVWNMMHVICVERIDKKVSKVLFMKMDITSVMETQIQNEAILKDALYMAQCANKAKTIFLSNMSHDIRTPMNAIMGFTALALNDIGNVEKTELYLEKIATSSEHLLSLINDVLEMSRIESGKVKLDEAVYNVVDITKTIYEMMNAQAEEKGIEFGLDIVVQQPYVFCDKLRMNQIMINLVSNAIKYTPAGGKVFLSFEQVGKFHDKYEKYCIKVKDTGYGMSKEFLEHVFEPFERAQSSTISKIPGTGLGLAIVKNIVEMMGGTIQVKSQENCGSEFTINLELRVADAYMAADECNRKEYNNFEYKLKGKRVLLAEDNEINAEITVEILSNEGMIVEVAENGQIAVDKFKESEEHYYDLVLMDIQMPVMDGLEAAKSIRLLQRSDVSLPIIAVSANAFDEDVRNSMNSGMDGHISKPIMVEKLFDTIKKIAQQKENNNQK